MQSRIDGSKYNGHDTGAAVYFETAAEHKLSAVSFATESDKLLSFRCQVTICKAYSMLLKMALLTMTYDCRLFLTADSHMCVYTCGANFVYKASYFCRLFRMELNDDGSQSDVWQETASLCRIWDNGNKNKIVATA
jgi:hypothetical protein